MEWLYISKYLKLESTASNYTATGVWLQDKLASIYQNKNYFFALDIKFSGIHMARAVA